MWELSLLLGKKWVGGHILTGLIIWVLVLAAHGAAKKGNFNFVVPKEVLYQLCPRA